ncbi:MAG TPA: hypothetical protein VF701_00220 [Thermoanaerobaculia bacterium]
MRLIVREVRKRTGAGGHHEFEELCASVTDEFRSEEFSAFWDGLSAPSELPAKPPPSPESLSKGRLIDMLSILCVV